MPVMDLRYECRLPLFSFNALSFAHEMQSCFSLGPIHSLIADLNGIRHDGNKIIYKSRVHAPRAHTHISLSSIRFCIFYWIILLQFWSNEEVFSLSLVSLSLSSHLLRSIIRSIVRSSSADQTVHILDLYAFRCCCCCLFSIQLTPHGRRASERAPSLR